MIRIWGRSDSAPNQRVMWTCREIGIQYDRIDAGGRYGQVDTDAFRARNPNGLVPAVEVNGQYLWESNSIVRYLVAQHQPNHLWIADPLARAQAEKWMDWAISVGSPSLVPVYDGLIRTGDKSLIPKSIERSEAAWSAVERALSNSEYPEYLGGPQFSIADISCGVLVHRWMALDIRRPSLPLVEAWYRRLTERPPFRELVMIPLT